nr:MAG TPA: hypothetical protein [Caudoviricetes sp.]
MHRIPYFGSSNSIYAPEPYLPIVNRLKRGYLSMFYITSCVPIRNYITDFVAHFLAVSYLPL